jgi:hypothetical protein
MVPQGGVGMRTLPPPAREKGVRQPTDAGLRVFGVQKSPNKARPLPATKTRLSVSSVPFKP